MAKTSGGTPPRSTDLEGWRQAIADGRLTTFRLEHIAAAFQNLGPADRRVYDALTRHLSGAIMGMLLKRVDHNRPNWGKDIVDEVHDEIFAALLQPNSADGTPINETFVNGLAGGGFIAQQRNAVLVGGTGTGKTHLAIAVSQSQT